MFYYLILMIFCINYVVSNYVQMIFVLVDFFPSTCTFNFQSLLLIISVNILYYFTENLMLEKVIFLAVKHYDFYPCKTRIRAYLGRVFLNILLI